jgi:hypothetical protein
MNFVLHFYEVMVIPNTHAIESINTLVFISFWWDVLFFVFLLKNKKIKNKK